MENSTLQENTVQANYTAQFAETLRKLLDTSPKRHEKTTSRALAEHLNVKQQSVSSWANGITIPDTRHIVPIADYFGVSCDYLLGCDTAPTHIVSDICGETGLAPEPVEVLRMVVNNMRVDEFFNVDKKSMDYYEIKAINHLIANCNSALTQIGLYLFGKLEMPERIPIKGASINLVGADEYVRRGMLKTLEEKLMNYRKMLLDNGGDLPLNLVLEKTRTDRKESFIKSRAEYLESVKGRPLTVAERAEQGELWERSQQATTAELVREMDELKKNGNKGTGG